MSMPESASWGICSIWSVPEVFENAYVNTKFLSWALMIRMPSLVIDETQMAPGTLQLHIAFSPWWTRKIFNFYISVQLWVRC